MRAFSKVLPLWLLHGDPADQVERGSRLIRAVGDDEVVVGLPAHAAADVGEFGVETCRGLSVSSSQLSVGFRMESPASAGNSGWPGKSEAQDAVDFDDRLL